MRGATSRRDLEQRAPDAERRSSCLDTIGTSGAAPAAEAQGTLEQSEGHALGFLARCHKKLVEDDGSAGADRNLAVV